MDSFNNFATTRIHVAPAPMAAGTTFSVEDPSVFPAVPFSATVWPSGDPAATVDNSETVRVTAVSGKTLTVVRAQEGSSPLKLWPGYSIAQLPTKLFYQSIADGAVATAVPQAVAQAVAVALPQAAVQAEIIAEDTLQGAYTSEIPEALGTAAAGTRNFAARTDHVHTMPKLDDTAAPDDNTDRNATTTAHGLLLKATAPAAGLQNVVAIRNGETAYVNRALFDTTNPAAIGTAAPGTALVAARQDHVHALPTNVTVVGNFGCNGQAAQAGYASGGALAACVAGTKGLDSDANVAALHALVVSMRAALVANGIMT